MRDIHTVIIGGGQAGLAMSQCLTDRSIEHVVLERAHVAERWRSERWDSLRLLTPNWMSRLPGYSYTGSEPDNYMTMPEVVRFLERYSRVSRVPLETHTEVRKVEHSGGRFQLETSQDNWKARNVVIATGYCDRPFTPDFAAKLVSDVHQLTPSQYRNPDQLPPGGVLIVGAAASGVQLADEIVESGRSVTLSVGRHIRMVRRYRGRDILWWFDRMGILDKTADEVYDLEASREQPALQLVGRPDHSTIDLGTLLENGVRLTGRAQSVQGSRIFFSSDLIATTTAADVKLASLLSRIDQFIDRHGMNEEVEEEEPFSPLWPLFLSMPTITSFDLRAQGIETVIWATGFRRSYPWLQIPVLNDQGEIRHARGITPLPGLYVLGHQFQSRRKSAFIDGVGKDATDLAEHLARRTMPRTAAVA